MRIYQVHIQFVQQIAISFGPKIVSLWSKIFLTQTLSQTFCYIEGQYTIPNRKRNWMWRRLLKPLFYYIWYTMGYIFQRVFVGYKDHISVSKLINGYQAARKVGGILIYNLSSSKKGEFVWERDALLSMRSNIFFIFNQPRYGCQKVV